MYIIQTPNESVAINMILSKEQLKTIYLYENSLAKVKFQRIIIVDDFLEKNGKISTKIDETPETSNIPPKHPTALTPIESPVKIVKLKQKFDKNMCYICKLKFSRRDNLQRHKNSVHLGQKFPCGGCGKGFSRKDKLIAHKCRGEKVNK